MVARVTAGLAESNGSLLPGLWLTSPAGGLPRTGISSRTLCSVIEYGLPLLFYSHVADLRSLSLCVAGTRRRRCKSTSSCLSAVQRSDARVSNEILQHSDCTSLPEHAAHLPVSAARSVAAESCRCGWWEVIGCNGSVYLSLRPRS